MLDNFIFKKDAQTQTLNEDDIAVLSRNHDGLDKVQFELERLEYELIGHQNEVFLIAQ